jgi:hypothetical protein
MNFPTQTAYDAFVDQTARNALETWRKLDKIGGDGQDEAQEQIWRAAGKAITSHKTAGQVIQYFKGDQDDVVVGMRPTDVILAQAIALIECDARDLLWKLRTLDE